MHYLFYDCETGGFNPDQDSLLTAYFEVCGENLITKDSLYLQLKPADITKLNASAEALQVNKINIQEHVDDPNTLTYTEGREKLLDFLKKHKIKGKRKHFRPCGHNINFDNRFLWKQMIPQDEWEKLVHYHQLDTTNVATFLQDTGILPLKLNTKLTGLVEYFGITEIDAHNAMGDVKMNIQVYKKMRELLSSVKKNVALESSSENNLLKIIEA